MVRPCIWKIYCCAMRCGFALSSDLMGRLARDVAVADPLSKSLDVTRGGLKALHPFRPVAASTRQPAGGREATS
ncbi:hypothetical protein D3C87_1298870 [compost metagenome]